MSPANQNFIDLRTRAEFLELCDDHEGAAALRARSFEVAREIDLTCYAYQLLWRNRVEEAIELLEFGAARHPDSWNLWHSLGEAFAQFGDVSRAAECYDRALERVEDDRGRLQIERSVSQLVVLAS